jgi:thiol-disulfide isomerase/thioredoxin
MSKPLLLATAATLVLLAAASTHAQTSKPAPAAPASALPAVQGPTTKKQAFDLAQLRGKVALLFFWSTDCPVCLDKLPEYRRNLHGWKGKDFVIVAINQDRTMSDLIAYQAVLMRAAPGDAQIDAQMPILWRNDPTYRDSFGELPTRAPTTVIVGRDGKIVKTIRGRVAVDVWDDVAELVLN